MIALLAGMLLPALSKAKAKAIKCIGSLKQISLSNYMYISDTGKPVHYESWPYLWISQLQEKYAAIKDVRFCPSAPEPSDVALKKDSAGFGTVNRAWLVDAWPVETDRLARNLYNGDKFQGAMVRFTILRHAAGREAAVTNFNPKDRLPGGVNVAFADNHVELARLENLWNLTWHKNWRAPAVRSGK